MARKKEIQDAVLDEKEQVNENVSFGLFDGESEIDDFNDEFSQEKEKASESAYADYEDLTEDNDAETSPLPDVDASNAEIFIMLLKFVDETRAVVASMYSGEEKEKYLFYKDIGKDHYMVQAGARVVTKYNLKAAPEIIIAMGLVGSSLYVGRMAMNDSKAKDIKRTTSSDTGKEQKINRRF